MALNICTCHLADIRGSIPARATIPLCPILYAYPLQLPNTSFGPREISLLAFGSVAASGTVLAALGPDRNG